MALNIHKIVAIIDPTTDKQLALTRALNVAQQVNAAVHAYICCYSPIETDHFLALKRVEIARHEAWLEKIIGDEDLRGVAVTTEVEWREDWREGIADSARGCEADLIVKAAYEHRSPGRLLLKTSDWAVLRNASCPVLFVKRDPSMPVQRVLVAVNPKVEDLTHRQLNEDIIAIGKQISAHEGGAELHAVSALTGGEEFTSAPELAALLEIDEARAYCNAGPPDEVIVDSAKLLQPDLVVIGTESRSGLGGLSKPNTAERALDRLESDVLVVTAAA